MTSQKPTIVPVTSLPESEPITIAKPGEFCLDKFKSKRATTIAGVGTLQTALPHHSMAEAKDWVRLHPNEAEYWSPEFCFVSVPIKGQKRQPSSRSRRCRRASRSRSRPYPTLPLRAGDQAA